jgi:hypothetical protein
MTFLNWNRRAASLVATLLAVGLVSACTDPETNAGNARADIKVTLSQGLAASDVTRISVAVEGSGIPTPITAELVKNGTAWEGSIQNIPAGADRYFTATAYDASGAGIYKGRAGPITIASGSVASVVIVLQQTHPQAPFENVAPIIESLVASSNPVQPGSSLTLTSRAFDPNPGDTLSYTWSASAGRLGSPTAPSTSWTAPATEGTQRLILEVKDSRGASTTMSLDILVQGRDSVGGAQVSTSFNTWPSISTMTGYPSPLVPGTATKLSVSASDADGDFLRFSWSTSCPGGFDNPSSPQPTFTLSEPTSASSCGFRVLISDGRGGQQSGSLTLHVRGTTPPPNQPPMILRAYSSSPQAGGSELITLGIHAQDPEGLPLSFGWSPSQGVIRADRSTPTSSEIDWQAPTCFDAPVNITVHIKDAAGLSATHVFFISPRPGAECGSLSVNGVRNVTYVESDTLRHTVRDDLSTLNIGAWVPTADGTGLEYRAGTGRPDGTFVIPDVQRTPYFLQLGTSYTWTTSRKHELNRTMLGRPFAEPLAQGLFLDLQLSGLTPWRAANDLQFHAPTIGLGYFTSSCASPAFPAQEGNAFISGTLEYAESLEACGNTVTRLDPARGDLFYVTHMESRVAPGSDANVQEVRQALVTKTLPEISPGTFQLSGTMSPLALVKQPMDFRVSEFEAQVLAAHPSAKLTTNNLNIGTLQGYKEFGTYIGWPDLALAFDRTPGQGDSLMTLEYGDPYPTSWARFVYASASASVSYTATMPDGTPSAPRSISVNVTTHEPLRAGATHLLRPQIGPPRDLKINGQPATTERLGVGPSPLVTWSPPALGTAARYSVRLHRFTATSTGSTSRVQVATFNTTEPRLQLPPNLLVSGPTYALQVYAYAPSAIPGASTHYASALTSGFKP